MAYPDDYEAPFVPSADQRVVSIENNGLWTRGGTYTVTWYMHWWLIDPSLFVGNNYYLYRIAPMMELGSNSIVSNVTNPLFSVEHQADSYVINSPFGVQSFTSDHWTDYTTLAMNTDISHSSSFGTLMGGEFDHDGRTNFYFKHLFTSIFTVPINAERGMYGLAYEGYFADTDPSPNENSETQRVYYPIRVTSESFSDGFPQQRPFGYDEDAVWDPKVNGWTSDLADLTTLGGGRYGKQIVVVSNKARLFFGDL